MSPTEIAALVAAQTPEHAQCRAQELVGFTDDGRAIVQCACNVRLILKVPRAAAPAEAAKTSKAMKGAYDAS